MSLYSVQAGAALRHVFWYTVTDVRSGCLRRPEVSHKRQRPRQQWLPVKLLPAQKPLVFCDLIRLVIQVTALKW